MKGGLFWKILVGFWLTLFCIIEGLWLAFVVRNSTSAEEWMARRVAPSVLSQLALAVHEGGPAAYASALRVLPAEDRSQISLVRAGQGAPVKTELSQVAAAPDGERYVLAYRVPPRKRGGPFNIPWPIVVAGAIAGLIFSVVLAWYLTRPIKLLRDGFDRLAGGELAVRLQPSMGRRRDEIAGLARDFDVMAGRLEQLVSARDRLLHDVSHELRSPLSRMQLAIALARQNPERSHQSMDRIEREVARLDTLVHELLVLARAESGAAATEEYFDPLAVLEFVLADARFEAQGKAVSVQVKLPDLPEELRPNLGGSAELFRRALENILRNALRFAPAASVIDVAASLVAGGTEYRIAVIDRGPGVHGTDLETLFDPFIKADQAGFGLGLAIAKRAVAAHGGTITASNMAPGFRIDMILPIAHGR